MKTFNDKSDVKKDHDGDFSKMANNFQIHPSTDMQVVKVRIKVGPLLVQYAEQLIKLRSAKNLTCPKKEDLLMFFDSLIKARIQQVTNDRCVLPPSSKSWKIPNFLMFLLARIGPVELPKFNLVLVPEYVASEYAFDEKKANKKSTPSDESSFITRIGFLLFSKAEKSCGECLPFSQEGDSDFMCFWMVGDKVVTYHTEAEPIIALASAFVDAQLSRECFKLTCEYGSLDYFKQLVPELASDGLVSTSV
uniref:Uncharacterized protein n=1 Tax=viral metagenome TaxID=1070528 RepID=A0A2V0RI36_9ZZZZ